MKRILSLFLLSVVALAQTPEQKEQQDLSRAIGEAGDSAVDIIRALEQHLQRYPETKNRAAIEMGLLRASMDAGDHNRIVLYGDKVLARPTDQYPLLERVAHELVDKGDPDSAGRAVVYLHRFEGAMTEMRSKPPDQHFTVGQWHEQADRAIARGLALEAAALINASKPAEAAEKARLSWQTWPTAEGARRVADAISGTGHDAEALDWYARAFTLEDTSSTLTDHEKDRTHLGALYAKIHGSDTGLGDMILETWDQMAALSRDRAEQARAADPNGTAADIYGFTLQPVGDGKPLALSSLKGKVVVLDFWATWCMPCRAQHPMLENVKRRFSDSKDLIFVPADSDDDPSLAAPFLKEQGWEGPAWFEGGLERRLMISSIPTVIVLDRAGHISSRMTGMIPERFEQMLTDRINEALK